MLYISFDLSFTGTGICMMDDASKRISFWQVKTNLEKKKTFDSVQRGITSILQGIDNIIADYEQDNNLTIVMEQPFVGGCWSAGLYGFDSASELLIGIPRDLCSKHQTSQVLNL